MRAFADSDPSKTVVCDRCGLKYRPDQITRAGDGSWKLCHGCIEYFDQPDEEYSAKVAHEGEFEDEAVVVAEIPEHANALLTRTSAGLRVEACFLPLMDTTGIAVTLDGVQAWASVEKSDLLDAFHHPALYIGPEQCEKIGLR